MIIYTEKMPECINGHVVILNGKDLMTSEEFLQEIWLGLNFPFEPEQGRTWDAYLDWMRDLSWYEEKSVTIVIENYADFLSKEPAAKAAFMEDFKTVILPFWKEYAETVFDDPRDWKTVNLILADGWIKDFGVKPVFQIMNGIDKSIHQGRKVAHCYSIPLLVEQDGEICLATFEIAIDGRLLKQGCCKEPHSYILADATDGNILVLSQKVNGQEESNNGVIEFFDPQLKVSNDKRLYLYHKIDLFRAAAKVNAWPSYDKMERINTEIIEMYPKAFGPYFDLMKNVLRQTPSKRSDEESRQ